jgi:ribosomal protein S12 methylthiotransferase accessory factor
MRHSTSRARPNVALSPVDPVTGIVTEVFESPVQPGDPGVFVAISRIANFASYALPVNATNTGSGAGLSFEAAYWAAVGESLERYACAINHPEDVTVGSYKDLSRQGMSLVPPEKWALFSPEQHEHKLPYSTFDSDTVIGWVEADNLLSRTAAWVPACLVYMPYAPPAVGTEKMIGFATSTGLACARTPRSALLSGICEVVERDAFTIVWRNRIGSPEVIIDGRSPTSALFKRHFARPGLEYRLFYTTLDLGIPSFFGYLRDERAVPPTLTVGGAAHPDPQVAVLKTLLELVQGLQWVNAVKRPGFAPAPGFDNVRSFKDHMALYAFNDLIEVFSFLTNTSERIELSSISKWTESEHPVQEIVRNLGEAGLDILARDLTSVDVEQSGMCVVKTIVPQCEIVEGDFRFPYLGGARWRAYAPSQPTASRPLPVNTFPHPYP